jgi:hypothetical protein
MLQYQKNYIEKLICGIRCATIKKNKHDYISRSCYNITFIEDKKEVFETDNIRNIINPDNIIKIKVMTITPSIGNKKDKLFCISIDFTMIFTTNDNQHYYLNVINCDDDEQEKRQLKVILNKMEDISEITENIMEQCYFKNNIDTSDKVNIYNTLPLITDTEKISSCIETFYDLDEEENYGICKNIMEVSKLYNDWNIFCKKQNINVTPKQFIEDCSDVTVDCEINNETEEIIELNNLRKRMFLYKSSICDFDPKEFEECAGVSNPSGGGVNVTYNIHLKTLTIDQLFEMFDKKNISACKIVQDFSMKDYYNKVKEFVFELKDSYIYVDYDDDNSSCAGHYIRCIITEYKTIEDLCTENQLSDLVKEYVKKHAPKIISYNYSYVSGLCAWFC